MMHLYFLAQNINNKAGVLSTYGLLMTQLLVVWTQGENEYETPDLRYGTLIMITVLEILQCLTSYCIFITVVNRSV